MPERFDVAFNPKLRPFIEKALADPEVKKMLAYYHLKENDQGIAKLALTLLLKDMGIAPDSLPRKRADNKK